MNFTSKSGYDNSNYVLEWKIIRNTKNGTWKWGKNLKTASKKKKDVEF